MRYFLDTEFVEDGKTIDLLSLALVAEDGRELYIETRLALAAMRFPKQYDPWMQENVIPYLGQVPNALTEPKDVMGRVFDMMAPTSYGKPEVWAYYADYDWVAFCQIFGRMIDLPDGFPMYCRDLKQVADERGIDLSKAVPQENEHHALADARWNKAAYDFLFPAPTTTEEVESHE